MFDTHGEHQAHDDRQDARYDEGGSPSCKLNQRAGDQRRGCDPQVAPDTIDPEFLAYLFSMCGEHGCANWMVDRRDNTDRKQADSQLKGGLRQTDADQRKSHSDKENNHHVTPAPTITEPS